MKLISYTIRQPKIVYEILNFEVIVIDFNTGDYYVLTHAAKQIWQLIEQHMSHDQMVEILSLYYQKEASVLAGDLQQFIDQLLEKGLIELKEIEEQRDPILIHSHEKEYFLPRLHAYTDVQNLLLLDPIHEVTDAGWPHALS